MKANDQALLLLKPDCVNMELVDQVVAEMESRGGRLKDYGVIEFDKDSIEMLYSKYTDAWFFPELVDYLLEAPCVVTVWEGKNIHEIALELRGNSYSKEGFRGKYSSCPIEREEGDPILLKNVMHVSDVEDFEYEYELLNSLKV
jgi:nucleoside diphosphate kinase